MRIDIEKLRPDHIRDIQLQDPQSFLQSALTAEYAEELCAQAGVAWAAVADGRTIACAGLLEMWPGRAQGWALFSAAALGNFVGIHRMAKRVLCDSAWQRVEVTVDAGHAAGVRWAERLGFTLEGRMRKYTSDGRDCLLYARVEE